MQLTPKKTRVLYLLGLTGLSLQGTVLMLLTRSGRITSRTDFALGALIGVSVGLLLLVVIGKRRKLVDTMRRRPPTSHR